MSGLSALAVTRCTEEFDRFVGEDCPRLPGQLLFAKLWGSWSHHTALPTSDFDFIAVYQAPAISFLGLKTPDETVVHDKPDWQAYELGKFVRLLRTGNPGILECLFTEEFMISSPTFDFLRSRRRDFLTVSAVNAYQKYAEGQLAKLLKGMAVHAKGGEPNEKWAYHVCRLLQDALSISQGGEPKVIKTGADLDFLMGIRTGAVPLEQAISFAHASVKALEATRSAWKVAPDLDSDGLSRWLEGVRKAELLATAG